MRPPAKRRKNGGDRAGNRRSRRRFNEAACKEAEKLGTSGKPFLVILGFNEAACKEAEKPSRPKRAARASSSLQ